jgi:hypothetical protein
MLSAQKAEEGLLLVTGSSDINSSVVNDTNHFLHVRGNLLGNLTIELREVLSHLGCRSHRIYYAI